MVTSEFVTARIELPIELGSQTLNGILGLMRSKELTVMKSEIGSTPTSTNTTRSKSPVHVLLSEIGRTVLVGTANTFETQELLDVPRSLEIVATKQSEDGPKTVPTTNIASSL